MEQLNGNRMNLVVVGIVAAVVLAGENARADFTFGEITNLGPPVNSDCQDSGASLSADGLSLFFDSDRPDHGDWDLFVVTRETPDSDWGNPMNLGPNVNKSEDSEWDASISADGLELYFTRGTRHLTLNDRNLYVTTRETTDDDWGTAVDLGTTVNSLANDGCACISSDGLSLYFVSNRSGGQGRADIWVTTRPTINTDWGVPTNLGSIVNSSSSEFAPSITADGLALIFSSNRSVMHGSGCNLWVTIRRTTSEPWREPFNLGPFINTNDNVDFADISPDGSTLFVSCYKLQQSGAYGRYDIWQAPIIPIVDLNGDSIVDSIDMCIMVDHWGTDNSLCDIGPMPWGDGIVDVQDLIVLSEHLFEDYSLIAHWELNEAEGSIAYDSIQGNDGTCYGEPLWVPAGGKIGGALQFDGIDDYISTPFILDPYEGSVSAFVWIYGGAPGQAMISQANSTLGSDSTWLGLNPSDGKLITRLMHPPFPPLESESVITDGQWHHVGLVYDRDSLRRHLYVDGAEVAKDIGPVPAIGSNGNPYIGADEILNDTSFFSGLIDDVRIYERSLIAEEIEVLAQ